jgi:tetratricopeptide (TPR) repeat protein
VCARGRYTEARVLLRRVIALAEGRLGVYDLDVAVALNALGMVGKYSGRFDEAAAAYRRVRRIMRQHGDDSVDVATLFHNLAGLEHARGRFARAELLARRALDLRAGTLPPGHLHVAIEMAALAPIVSAAGKPAEALPLLRRAIVVFRRAYGPRSYDVAVAYHNLAAAHAALGRLAEAKRLYGRAIAIKTRLIGAGHPDTALSRNNLASLRRGRR